MSQHGDTELPEPTAAETERLRALLSDARAVEPAPAEVTARLDAALAALVAVRRHEADAPAAATVTSLDAGRRSPRRWPKVVLAAAAVVVAGYGVSTLGPVGGAGDDDAGAAGGQSALSRPDAAERGSVGGGDSSPAPSATQQEESAPSVTRLTPPTTLGADTLDRDLARLADRLAAQAPVGRPVPDSRCAVPTSSAGATLVATSLDGRPVTALVRARPDGTRRVVVYACRPAVPLARAVVP